MRKSHYSLWMKFTHVTHYSINSVHRLRTDPPPAEANGKAFIDLNGTLNASTLMTGMKWNLTYITEWNSGNQHRCSSCVPEALDAKLQICHSGPCFPSEPELHSRHHAQAGILRAKHLPPRGSKHQARFWGQFLDQLAKHHRFSIQMSCCTYPHSSLPSSVPWIQVLWKPSRHGLFRGTPPVKMSPASL